MNKNTNTLKASGSGFTVVENQLIQDPEIHPLAKFLYVWMFSKIWVPDFVFWRSTLLQVLHLKDHRVLNRHIKQLIDNGWLHREERRESGRFKGWNYTINQVPFHHQSTGVRKTSHGNTSPECVSPVTVKTHPLISKDYIISKDLNKSNTKVLPKKSTIKSVFPPTTEQEERDFKNAVYLHALPKIQELVGKDIDPKAHAKDFAAQFFDHYKESNWRKNNGKKLKTWKSAASGWITRSAKNDEYLVHAVSSKEFKQKQKTGKQRTFNNQPPVATVYDRSIRRVADKDDKQ